MSNTTHEDTEPSHADAKRATAEIARIKAERRKFFFESEQIKRGLIRRWYTPRFVIEAVVGGAIAGGLFVVWLNGYLLPILHKEAELDRLDRQKQAAQVERDGLINDMKLMEITARQTKLQQDQAQLQQQYDGLLVQHTELANILTEVVGSPDLNQAFREELVRQIRLANLGIEAIHRIVAEGESEGTPVQGGELSLRKIDEKYNRLVVEGLVTTIPVVVHVVYRTKEEKVDEARIRSQITVLNECFRARNSDLADVPAPFKPHVGDAYVEFTLTSADPDGRPTNGITYTRTTKSVFSSDDSVKRQRTGGTDAWDTARYLNIWVCTLAGGLLEYAQLPGGPPQTDGVVLHNTIVGVTSNPPFDKGRGSVHSIGHYMGLRHIWGDTNGCDGTDYVADTPNARSPNMGNPTFPHVSCNNAPNGDMFMNFMDYVDDSVMLMFTKGQVVRMHQALAGPRAALATRDEKTDAE